MNTGKFEMDIKVSEHDFMEWCLNLKSSGYNPFPIMAIYALGKSWHITKLVYYKNLLEELE